MAARSSLDAAARPAPPGAPPDAAALPRDGSREARRRVVHVALVAGAFALPAMGWPLALSAAACAVVFNAFVLHRVALTSWLDRPDGDGRAGLVLYPLAILVLLAAFRDDLAVVQVGWIALAVGDGLAPFAGRLLPRPRWPWHPAKSMAASAAAHGVAAAVMLLVVPAPVAAAASAGGALGDGLSRWLDDNLAVPFAAAAGAAAVLAAGGFPA